MSAPPIVLKTMSFERPGPQSTPVADVTGARVLAAVIDLAAGFAVLLLMAATVGTFDTSHGLVVRLDGAPGLLWIAGWFLYFFLGEALAGRTLGKAALGLRVVHAHDGSRPGLGAIAARTALRPIDGLPLFYGLGLLTILLTPSRQRLGDLAARTVVVRTRP